MTKEKQRVPDEVKQSEFGCQNCLHDCIECKDGNLYKPHKAFDGQPSCKAYSFYD